MGDFRVTADSVYVEYSASKRKVEVEITGVDQDEFLEYIDLSEAVNFYTIDAVLDYIGVDYVKEYFGLEDEEEK